MARATAAGRSPIARWKKERVVRRNRADSCDCLLFRHKQEAHRRGHLRNITHPLQPAGRGINAKFNNIAAILIGDEEPRAIGIERKIAGSTSSARHLLYYSEFPAFAINRKYGNAVIAPIRGVQKFSIRMKGNLRRAIDAGGTRLAS